MSFTRRGRPQLTLATLLCGITVVAVWLALARVRGQISELSAKLPGLRDFARELQVLVPGQIAVVRQLPQWHNETQFRVYLPPGRHYELALAREQVDHSAWPPPLQTVPIGPGEHTIDISESERGNRHDVEIRLDGQTVMVDQRDPDWVQTSGHTTWSNHAEISRQFPADEPLDLVRMRYMERSSDGTRTHDQPGKGVLVWIKPQ